MVSTGTVLHRYIQGGDVRRERPILRREAVERLLHQGIVGQLEGQRVLGKGGGVDQQLPVIPFFSFAMISEK